MKRSHKAQVEKMAQVVEALKELYPSAECALEWGGSDPWRLLVMGRLSAQCTDKRVNIVCADLFLAYPTAEAMAAANITDVEELVKPCGLYRTKAKDLVEASKRLIEVYGGVLPQTMEELLTFPGVGRKIANLLLGDVFHQPAIVTDTHSIRICGKLGFYPETEKTPHKIEKILVKITDPAESSDFCHRIVWFGRDICTARSPKCVECPMSQKGLCDHALHKNKTKS